MVFTFNNHICRGTGRPVVSALFMRSRKSRNIRKGRSSHGYPKFITPPSFWRYVKPLVSAAFAIVSTRQHCARVVSYDQGLRQSNIALERNDIWIRGLPQSSPWQSVLRCPHPAASRDLHQIVGPPCGGPTNAASSGTRSPIEDLSAPTAVSPPRNLSCSLPLEVCNSSGYVYSLIIIINFYTHQLSSPN
jgi:hypothetical protein